MAAAYRTHIRIIGDILRTAEDEMHGCDEGSGGGASITRLIKRANIPHARVSGIVGTLVSQGLLERVIDDPRSAKYRISRSGREFLRAYREFSRFAGDFGLSI